MQDMIVEERHLGQDLGMHPHDRVYVVASVSSASGVSSAQLADDHPYLAALYSWPVTEVLHSWPATEVPQESRRRLTARR